MSRDAKQSVKRTRLEEARGSSPDVEPTEAAKERERALQALEVLKESSLIRGPHAKYILSVKPRRGRQSNNGIYPTHVGASAPISGLNIPAREDLVSNKWLSQTDAGKRTWGDNQPFSRERVKSKHDAGKGNSSSSSSSSSVARDQEKIRDFYRSLDSEMSDAWPKVMCPRKTANIFECWIDEWPLSLRTPGSEHMGGATEWGRWPFMLDAEDFPLRAFRVHLILSYSQQHNLHFGTDFTLRDRGTALAIQTESDIYRQYNRAVKDVSHTPLIVSRTNFNQWELVPLMVLRRRPVPTLFEWVYDRVEGYWSLPVRVDPFPTTLETLHPDYAKTTRDDVLARLPPSRMPDPSVIGKRVIVPDPVWMPSAEGLDEEMT